MFDMNTGQSQQVAAHDAPIKCIEYVEVNGNGILITAGWDKKMKVSNSHSHKAATNMPVLGPEGSGSRQHARAL
jgi:hypothetical protein